MRGDLPARLLLVLTAYCLGTNVTELHLKTPEDIKFWIADCHSIRNYFWSAKDDY